MIPPLLVREDATRRDRRELLTWLVGGPVVEALLLELLGDAAGGDAQDLLGRLTRLRVPVPAEEIVRLLDDAEARAAALDAAASQASLAPLVAAHLDTPGVRTGAGRDAVGVRASGGCRPACCSSAGSRTPGARRRTARAGCAR